jgi:predicted glutamine amidotransferase
MCIIIVKDKNIAFPDDKILEVCFKNNPDGAGFMVAIGGRVEIHKGFLQYPDFIRALYSVRARTGDNVPYVLHFRITTQAGVKASCTHPFPISRDMDDLKKIKCACALGMAHNGILSLTSHYDKKIEHNDTMEYITSVLAKLIKCNDFYNDSDIMDIIKITSKGSRFAFLSGDGTITMVGNGWQKIGDIYYSNESYLERQIITTGYYKYGDYESWYDYDSYFKRLEKTKK